MMTKRLVGGILFCFAVVSFLSYMKNSPTLHQVGHYDPLDQSMIRFLQNYIQIDTTHPKPHYEKAISFLKRQAQKDGFLYNEITLPSGNPVFVITYEGRDSSLPALVLNHHMDVVPASPKEWKVPPFSGAIVDGEIVGRGTQDMKGIGAVHYYALKALKDAGIVPQRTIHIFAVPDEEVGGFKGTNEFVKTDYFASLNVGFVVDEGHASGALDSLDIKVSERKPIQIRITSRGVLAHGSHLQVENSVHELILFLHELVSLHKEQQVKSEQEAPGKLLSCNVSSLTSGVKKENGHIALNMVPDRAEATVDIRVPPTMKKSEVITLLDEAIKKYPHMEYKIVAQAFEEPELKEYRTLLYNALERSIEKSGMKASPHFFEASSDLRFYQSRGIDGVGLTPFAIVDNIHGVDESVPLDELVKGRALIERFLKEFCCNV